MSFALDLLIFAVGWTHVLLAPFTKVEESFNLQATHDVLMYGVGPSNLPKYDHFTFPGAVPRTFIGSIVLAYISNLCIQTASFFGLILGKSDVQIIGENYPYFTQRFWNMLYQARGLETLWPSYWAFLHLDDGVSIPYTVLDGTYPPEHVRAGFRYALCKYHLIAGLKDSIVNLATYLLANRAPNSQSPTSRSTYIAISLLTFSGIVFRAELALLLAPIVMQSLYQGSCTFGGVVKTGLSTAAVSLALTVAVDTYFWQTSYPLWPEWSGIYFNVVEGKSAEWGTSPPWTYFTSHLPRLLMSALPLSGLSFLFDHRIRAILLPHLMFVVLISGLGHKEWRFIVYVVPAFNIAAARTARWMVSRRKSSFMGRIYFGAILAMLLVNFVLTASTTFASIHNYPGGVALQQYNDYVAQNFSRPAHVHISNLAAQTGASLFLQAYAPPFLSSQPHPKTVYDKTEGLTISSLTSSNYITHLISEVPPKEFGWLEQGKWKEVGVVEGFDGWVVDWDLLRGRLPADGGLWGVTKRLETVFETRKTAKLWILERK
ncbi:Dol-P-Man:Man(7)GlcNAc(2)-PP-Dol alpha-1,6-mannosyltransferase [Marasmius tenuissimus]|uniref:Mannosyltransferase n=1 Tax=Marasmius tenuissimus TaxID=585030 RepID=A0ABR3A2Q5_9AGAR